MNDDADGNDRYSDEEARQRLEAALRGARRVAPIQMKDIPRKRPYRPRKPKAPAASVKSASSA